MQSRRQSFSQWPVREKLTENFQAEIANSISGIQAPVDTMEQQAEHCQEERERKVSGREEMAKDRKK